MDQASRNNLRPQTTTSTPWRVNTWIAASWIEGSRTDYTPVRRATRPLRQTHGADPAALRPAAGALGANRNIAAIGPVRAARTAGKRLAHPRAASAIAKAVIGQDLRVQGSEQRALSAADYRSLDVRSGVIHEVHVMHARGTSGHAGKAGEAAIDVLDDVRRAALSFSSISLIR